MMHWDNDPTVPHGDTTFVAAILAVFGVGAVTWMLQHGLPPWYVLDPALVLAAFGLGWWVRGWR